MLTNTTAIELIVSSYLFKWLALSRLATLGCGGSSLVFEDPKSLSVSARHNPAILVILIYQRQLRSRQPSTRRAYLPQTTRRLSRQLRVRKLGQSNTGHQQQQEQQQQQQEDEEEEEEQQQQPQPQQQQQQQQKLTLS